MTKAHVNQPDDELLDSADVRHTARLLWQETLIKQVAGAMELFHPPYPNNYTWILLPQRVDSIAFHRSVRRLTAPLNQVDALLCEKCATLSESVQDAVPTDVLSALSNWKQLISGNSNLDSVHHAEKVVGFIRGSNIFPSGCKECLDDIGRQLLQVPNQTLSILRINFYLTYSKTLDVLAQMVQLMRELDSVFAHVDRVEIAKVSPSNNTPHYPTFIVYVHQHPNSVQERREIQTLLQSLTQFSDCCSARTPDSAQYCDRWLTNATVSQGFSLYKRYLSVFDLLEQVYDAKTSFAYLREDMNTSCFPAILEAIHLSNRNHPVS